MPAKRKPIFRMISILSGISSIFFWIILLLQFNPDILQQIDGQAAVVLPTYVAEASSPFFFRPGPQYQEPSAGSGMAVENIPVIEEELPIQATPVAAPTREWLEFNGFSMDNQTASMTFMPVCDAVAINLMDFYVIPWYTGVFTDGSFSVGRGNHVVAWEHLDYVGLWIHSGLDWLSQPQTAFPLQDYLERDAVGRVYTTAESAEIAANCLLGSRVNIKIGDNVRANRVSAVLRIPATGVDELSQHVMDMVPYLAEEYPGAGFEDLEPGTMLLYFCGRQLQWENTDPNKHYWAQSRFVVAIAP